MASEAGHVTTQIATDEPIIGDHVIISPNRPSTPLPPSIDQSYYFECKMCPRTFQSRYALECHMNKHVTCRQCLCEFKSLRELTNHRDYCARRFGVYQCRVRDPQPAFANPPPRVTQKPPRPVLPYHCPLCRRRYKTEAHLRNHQIFRCRKRYVAPGWCVKI